jgi:hypothetical protein
MWDILDFKVIFAADNSNKFQKMWFRKEKSIEDVVTLGPTNGTAHNSRNKKGSSLCKKFILCCTFPPFPLGNFHL